MSTIQNLKNFIRHGKQARNSNNSPHGEATTDVSNVHAHNQRFNEHVPPAQRQAAGITEPNVAEHRHPQHKVPAAGGFSTAAYDQQNQVARAGDVAARAVEDSQKSQKKQEQQQKQEHGRDANAKKKDYDPSVIERIVAEEREQQGKMPRYPGLERWNLVEKMGDGAFSNVYRAKDTQGQYGEVAIKVVRKFEMNSTQRSNILKEVSIMRRIEHPNIVGLVDFLEAKQYYYIVLELCPGGELFHQIVRLTYFSEDLSRHVIYQVAKALEYLHEDAGVVHRDIKPENLLFYPVPFIPTRNPKPKAPEDEDKVDEGEFVKGVGSGGIGVIKIADFGLSKVIWDSQTMTPCGTVGYTAPEIVKDERYSKSVDMWALGCVLYTLLCGFPPFYDESIQVLTEKVARGQYTFLSPWWDDISKSAQDLVSHLLTVNPDKRYDIKQFLSHPWVRETTEETYAAADAPPLATPLIQRQKESYLAAQHNPQQTTPQSGGNTNTLQPTAFDNLTPSVASNRRMDFRSPGAVNLREVFDVSYAVHRQEEETKRRKNFPQGYRGAANGLTSLNALDEGEEAEAAEYEDEYNSRSVPYGQGNANPPAKVPKAHVAGTGGSGADLSVSGVEQKMRNTSLSAAAQARGAQYGGGQGQGGHQQKGYGQHSPAVAAAARKQVRSNQQAAGPFELSLDNATLLGRRHKQGPV